MPTFQETGQAIWDAYGADKLNAGHRTLILQLARLADTADRLADLSAGRRDTWVSLVFDEMGEVHLSVDKILDQERNTQLAIKTVLSEIRQTGLKAQEMVGNLPVQADPEDMLTKRRMEREARERQLG